MNNYIIRIANKKNDDKNLNSLFTQIFYPEEVGTFAEVMFNHFPGMDNHYWFIAENKPSSQIVSAFALIPWVWEMKGIKLKVAEMGLVGTIEEHRGKGLMRLLHKEFNQTFQEDQFDLAVIQGIPGFYHKFGYHYAVAMENHINFPLHLVTANVENNKHIFRLAEKEDIPFLLDEDFRYRNNYLISSIRNELNFQYMFKEGLKTEYGSEFWIMQNKTGGDKFYFRINLKGFGTGLIVSELSEGINYPALCSMLWFCKQKAIERQKAYIRFNVHNQSNAAKMVFSMGAKKSLSYAWQIKIPDKLRFLSKLKPLLEDRMNTSIFKNYSGIFRLNLYKESIDITWNNGLVTSISESSENECANTFCIGSDLFPALALGHRTWEELQHIRPDVAPELLYVYPTEESLSDITGMLVNTLFPADKSWIYGQY